MQLLEPPENMLIYQVGIRLCCYELSPFTVFPAVYLLAHIYGKTCRHGTSCPESISAAFVHSLEHSPVYMVKQVIPSFFTPTLEAVYVPVYLKVIHKIRGDNDNIIIMAYLHKPAVFVSPLVAKQAIHVAGYDGSYFSIFNSPQHEFKGLTFCHTQLTRLP